MLCFYYLDCGDGITSIAHQMVHFTCSLPYINYTSITLSKKCRITSLCQGQPKAAWEAPKVLCLQRGTDPVAPQHSGSRALTQSLRQYLFWTPFCLLWCHLQLLFSASQECGRTKKSWPTIVFSEQLSLPTPNMDRHRVKEIYPWLWKVASP